MATSLINYDTEHVVAESTYLGATYGHGRILSLAVEQNIDNGKLLAKGDYIKSDLYKGKIPTDTDAVYLILNPPVGSTNFTKAMANDKYFYNEASNFTRRKYVGLRAYPLQKDNIFTVTAIGITPATANTEPVVGNYVVADGIDIKEVTKGNSLPAKAFVGEIIEKVTSTRGTKYRIQVVKNA